MTPEPAHSISDLALHVERNVRIALEEDMGGGDLTAQLIPAGTAGHATVITRQPMVLCGVAWFEGCFRALDPGCEIEWKVREGETAESDEVLCEIRGNARAMLSAERPALNFLQLLSATATETRRYVQAVKPASGQPAIPPGSQPPPER